MKLEEIVSVSGQPNLFKLIGSRTNGLILEDIDTKKRNFFSSRTYQFSPLDSIGIYTLTDTISLKEVFTRILQQADVTPPVSNQATEAELKAYVETIIPEYDRYRVHARDMKKLMRWFHFLSLHNLISLEELSKEEE